MIVFLLECKLRVETCPSLRVFLQGGRNENVDGEKCGHTPFNDWRKGWALRLQEGPRRWD